MNFQNRDHAFGSGVSPEEVVQGFSASTKKTGQARHDELLQKAGGESALKKGFKRPTNLTHAEAAEFFSLRRRLKIWRENAASRKTGGNR